MKLGFTPPNDGQPHTYCPACRNETVQHHKTGPRERTYRCTTCGHTDSRALIIDPKVSWWTDTAGEYWHETAGIFVANEGGEFLFFDRVKHPFGLTVPAGHVDFKEKPARAGVRELFEETTLRIPDLRPVAIDNIHGDECRRGADVHRWHIFATRLPKGQTVKVDASEGAHPVWMTLEAAKQAPLTPAIRHIIRHHTHALRAAVE